MDINVSTNISSNNKNIEILISAPEMTEKVQEITNSIIRIANSKKQILANKDSKTYIIAIDDIIFFYSENKNNYCKTIKDVFKISDKLYELEGSLSTNFVRISKSCIINLNYVESFDSNLTGTIEVIFKDGSKEYVSRRKIKEVMKKIKEWRN